MLTPDTVTSLPSRDGQLHLLARRKSVVEPAQLLCSEAGLLPRHALRDIELLAGPYELALSGDEPLARPLLLFFGHDHLALPQEAAAHAQLAVRRFGADGRRWRDLEARQGSGVLSVRARELGVCALVRSSR